MTLRWLHGGHPRREPPPARPPRKNATPGPPRHEIPTNSPGARVQATNVLRPVQRDLKRLVKTITTAQEQADSATAQQLDTLAAITMLELDAISQGRGVSIALLVQEASREGYISIEQAALAAGEGMDMATCRLCGDWPRAVNQQGLCTHCERDLAS